MLIPKHPAGCFADYRIFQMLWLDYNHNRRVIGTRVVWRCKGSNPNNPSTHHVRFHFLEGNWKCQMPVRTEEFDRATAEVTGTFDGVEEIWEGIVNNYFYMSFLKRKDVLAVLPTGCGKSLLFQLKSTLHWHMQWVKRGSVGNIKLLPRAKMLLVPMNFFLQRVDYDWANIY